MENEFHFAVTPNSYADGKTKGINKNNNSKGRSVISKSTKAIAHDAKDQTGNIQLFRVLELLGNNAKVEWGH